MPTREFESADASWPKPQEPTSQQKVKALVPHPSTTRLRSLFKECFQWARQRKVKRDSPGFISRRLRWWSPGKMRWKLGEEVETSELSFFSFCSGKDSSACVCARVGGWLGDGALQKKKEKKTSATSSPQGIFWNVTCQSLRLNLDWFSLWGSSFMSLRLYFSDHSKRWSLVSGGNSTLFGADMCFLSPRVQLDRALL